MLSENIQVLIWDTSYSFRVRLEPTATAAAAAEPRREPRLAAGRGRVEGGQEQAAAAAEDAFHLAAAAGAGGALHAEQIPRHGHQGGDLHVDQHRRAQSQGESETN